MDPKPAPRTSPAVPSPLALDAALRQSVPLVRLRALLRDSEARLEAIRPSLPPALARWVKAGPVDETGWSLIAANASVAAKLRQLQPRLEAVLAERGWEVNAVRIKVQSG